MRICQLASGSKGNCIYIESEKTRILIDAGLSALQIGRRLQQIGVDAADLDAVFVTHEHSDHCVGLGPLSRRYGVPVYIEPNTRHTLTRMGTVAEHFFTVGETIVCRDIQVQSFPITHDAVAPVGFIVETCVGKVGVATDLGIATRLVQHRLSGCRVLVLETNHDEELLRDGPYPWELKQRIRSQHGHLSNAACAELLEYLVWDGLEAVFLAHLSETNNTPQLARQAITTIIEAQNRCRPVVIVGAPHEVSDCFTYSG